MNICRCIKASITVQIYIFERTSLSDPNPDPDSLNPDDKSTQNNFTFYNIISFNWLMLMVKRYNFEIIIYYFQLGSGSGFRVFWIRIRTEILGWIRIQLNTDPKHWKKLYLFWVNRPQYRRNVYLLTKSSYFTRTVFNERTETNAVLTVNEINAFYY